MAEFQEVAEQKRRMCKIYDKNGCNGCPLNNGDCGVLNMRFTDANTVQRLEDTVMSWAAEHPEPVYPTWGEWLIKIGGAVKKLYAQQYHYEAAQPTQLIEVVEVLDEPIPADIAEKLGIEPKEG